LLSVVGAQNVEDWDRYLANRRFLQVGRSQLQQGVLDHIQVTESTKGSELISLSRIRMRGARGSADLSRTFLGLGRRSVMTSFTGGAGASSLTISPPLFMILFSPFTQV